MDGSSRDPFDFSGQGRPFWSDFLPACLFCNWDDDREGKASTLVATTTERSRKRAVAFLCIECFGEREIRTWFHETVRGRFPKADIQDRSAVEEPWDPENL